MCGQRAGQRGRCSPKEHRQLATNIHTCEVVVMGFGYRQAITNKHQVGLDGWSRLNLQADYGVPTQNQAFRAGLLDQRETRFVFVDLDRYQRHRLEIASGVSRSESGAGKLAGDVLGGLQVTRAASIPTFKFVIREKGHMRPPALAVRRTPGSRT